jgi:hypothetical protein
MKYSHLLIPAFLLLTGCTVDSERTTALANVFLVDAPADFDEVWVEVLGVEVEGPGTRGQDNSDPVFFPNILPNKQVNLMALLADNTFLVGRGELQVGNITKLRLRLGETNFVVIKGKEYPLVFSSESAQEPAIEVRIPLEAAISHDIFMDLELFRSISLQKNPDSVFVFNPQLRAFDSSTTGQITGSIRPSNEGAVIYAIKALDTVAVSGVEKSTGKFTVRGLVGNHRLSIAPFNSRYFGEIITEIPVEVRKSTRLEPITLRIRP